MSEPMRDPTSAAASAGSPPPGRRPSSRGLKIALAVSVALNLGVAGFGVGRAVLDWRGGPGDMVRAIGFGPFTDALTPLDREALRDQFIAKMPDFKVERQRMQADTAAILSALRAEPFDPGGLDAALSTMQDHITQRMGLGSGLIGDYIKALSPADRLAFADRLEESLRHGPGSGG
jgi:uncharacterized membrane protein